MTVGALIEDEDWDTDPDDGWCYECFVPFGHGWCEDCAVTSGADEDSALGVEP